jgi:hypothetical protein
MESYGVQNAIHISSDTAKLIDHKSYELKEREPMQIKGKGIMKTFLVNDL